MWTFLGIILVSFHVTIAQVDESFNITDLANIFLSEKTEGLGSTCEEHVKELVKGLQNNEMWAVHSKYFRLQTQKTRVSTQIKGCTAENLDDIMKVVKSNPVVIDSMAKFPEGVFVGHLSVPGVFDECVNAVNDKFSGKHCMPKLSLEEKDKFATLFNDVKPKAGKSIQFQLRMGICVPSTCNSTDVEHMFETAKDNIEFLQRFKINITEDDCSTKELRPFRNEDWVTVIVLAIIAIIALCSTLYDLKERFINKKQIPNKLWSSFSIYTNGKSLFTISQSTAQLKSLHGIRCLSMLWVILGHTYFTVLLGSPINVFDASELMYAKPFIPVSNAFLSVDSFFFLSGLLVCLVFFRDISKKKSFDVPVAFIHRYMRLTPPFALLMLIQSTLFSRMGNGPFWNEKIDPIEKQCRESWWSGILYLQNYLKPSTMCLGQAWYLSADMQMFWLSPLILYPLLWFPHFAVYFLTILTLAAAFTNFAIGYVNELAPTFLLNLGIKTLKQFELEYAPFHTRMAPWLIGLATGYIICGIQAKKIRLNLSKTSVIAGWGASLFLLGGSFLGILRFIWTESTDYNQLESSFYLAFHRVGWALGMGWVVVACVAGYGGPVNTILSFDSFQILGKLSYCNFLVHMAIQNYRVNSSRVNQYLRHFDIVYAYFGDVLISHLISIPVVLLFELPFSNLDRHFLRKLVIFPLPRPEKNEKEFEEKAQEEEKTSPTGQKSQPSPEDVEKGKVNPAFDET